MEKTVSRKERNRMLAREHSLEFVRLFRKNKAAMLGLAILTVFVLAAVFAI